MSHPTFPKTSLRLVSALSAIALACSAYLLYQGVTGSYNPCCGHVLDSRWAKWFGLPVSAFAIALYALLFLTAIPATAAAKPGFVGPVLRAGALLAAGAALWFFAVLLFIEKATCPYCIATHLCGLSIAATVFAMRRSLPGTGALPYAGAALALATLISGQFLGRDRVEITGAAQTANATPPTTDASGAQNIAFAPNLSLKIGEFPMVGPENPTHYLAEVFDYTCKSCRNMYGDLKLLEKAHPGVFTVIYVPAPLHRACNQYITDRRIKDHEHACELARIALAVWTAKPEKFPEYHDSMMTRPLPIAPADAEAKAISLVGKDAFEKAQRSPAIKRSQQTALGHYDSLVRGDGTKPPNIMMPKLLLGNGALMQGAAPSPQAFVDGMATHFLLK